MKTISVIIASIICIIFSCNIFCGETSAPQRDIDGACVLQQKAIADMTATLKQIKKAISKNSKGGKSEKKEDVENMPDMPPGENPENMLKEAEGAQEKIDDAVKEDLAKEKNPEEADKVREDLQKLSGKQSEVSSKLEKLAGKKSIQDPETNENLKSGGQSSSEAESAMKSGGVKASSMKSAQTLSSIKRALQLLREKADAEKEKVLSDAQKKLNKMIRDSKKGESPEKTGEELKGLSEKFKDAAVKQHKGGRQSNAQEFAELAKKTKKSSGEIKKMEQGKATAALEKLRDEMLKDRNSGSNKGSEEMISELEEMRKTLDYMEKHKDSKDGYNGGDLLSDLEVAAQDIKESQKSKSGRQVSKELIEKANSLISDIEGIFNSAGTAKEEDFLNDEEAKKALRDGIANLVAKLKELPETKDNTFSKRQFRSDEVPEEYRELTALYFEKLSGKKQERASTEK